MGRELFDKAVAFHGHVCGGIALGARACMEAIDRLGIRFSEDEDLVCVTENDACGVDAVQAILGCTMGKGNLIYYGTGKMAFSFYNRKSGESFRLIARPKKPGGPKGQEYIDFVLTGPLEEIFAVTETRYPLPEQARSLATVTCEICGEGAPETKMRLQDGKKVCLECFRDYSRGW